MDTHLITYGAGLAISGLGFARGYSIAAMNISSAADVKGHIGTTFQYLATLLGTGLTWQGTIMSSQPLLDKQDLGTAIAVMQATAAAKGVFFGLIAGAVAGYVVQKVLGRFFD